jgi:hypothetical protein
VSHHRRSNRLTTSIAVARRVPGYPHEKTRLTLYVTFAQRKRVLFPFVAKGDPETATAALNGGH